MKKTEGRKPRETVAFNRTHCYACELLKFEIAFIFFNNHSHHAAARQLLFDLNLMIANTNFR
jgi:hypothetical protein